MNGHPTEAILSITNDEPEPITVAFIGGSLWGTGMPGGYSANTIVRNLTTTRYNVEIPAGAADSLSYSFATELHPQDLKLLLVSVVVDSEGGIRNLQAFNETVSVVEPDASIFDVQM